jgi:hypothetical protein
LQYAYNSADIRNGRNIRNKDIVKELKTEPILYTILEYKPNSISLVKRMQRNRFQKYYKITDHTDRGTEELVVQTTR